MRGILVTATLVAVGLGMAIPEPAAANHYCAANARNANALVQLWRDAKCQGPSVSAGGWRPNFKQFADTATGQTYDVNNTRSSLAIRPGHCVRLWNKPGYAGEASNLLCTPPDPEDWGLYAFDDRAASMKVCAADRRAECNADGPASTLPGGGGGNPTPAPAPSPAPAPAPGPAPPAADDDEPDPVRTQPAPVARCTASTLKVGPLTATASCFSRDGDAYVATGQVRVGGVDLIAPSGASVRIRPKALQVSTRGAVDVKVGTFVLYRKQLDWNLGGTFTFGVAPGIKLRGLPVVGQATMTVDAAAKSVDVGLTVQLPSVLGGVTGGTSIRVGPDGVAVQDVNIAAGSARLGRFELRDLSLAYSKQGKGVHHFDGAATLVLPAPRAPTISAELGIGVGDDYFRAGGELDGLNRPLSTGVFLQRIRFEIQLSPFALSGGLGISAGPQILGREAVSLDGDFKFEEGPPDRYTISGSGKIADIEVGSGSLTYQTDGRLDVSAEAKIEKYGVGFSGSIAGWVDGSSAFNIQGDGEAKYGPFTTGAEAVVSSEGMAACRKGTGPDIGFGLSWDDASDVSIFSSSCGIGPWVVEEPTARSAQAGERFATFGIGEGTPVATFSAVGQAGSGPPRVRLEDPRGRVVTVTPVDPNVAENTPQVVHFQHLPTNTTYLAVEAPRAGTYKLVVENGAPPAAQLRAAQALPAPDIRARVSGKGRSRLLSFRMRAAKGQKVTFYEQGPDTRRKLGARRTTGRLRFAVPDGRAGRRQILAVVSQNGVPLQTGAVASYVAPPPRRPGRPASVRVTSRGGKYLVRWSGARRAASYEVRIYVGDGRRLLYLPTRNARRVDIPGARKGLRVNVTVRGLTSTGLRGPRGRDSYRPR